MIATIKYDNLTEVVQEKAVKDDVTAKLEQFAAEKGLKYSILRQKFPQKKYMYFLAEANGYSLSRWVRIGRSASDVVKFIEAVTTLETPESEFSRESVYNPDLTPPRHWNRDKILKERKRILETRRRQNGS